MYLIDISFTGTVYFMLGNLDPSLRSRLENIHLVALFQSELLYHKNYLCLMPVFKKLKDMTNVSESSRAPSSGYKN